MASGNPRQQANRLVTGMARSRKASTQAPEETGYVARSAARLRGKAASVPQAKAQPTRNARKAQQPSQPALVKPVALKGIGKVAALRPSLDHPGKFYITEPGSRRRIVNGYYLPGEITAVLKANGLTLQAPPSGTIAHGLLTTGRREAIKVQAQAQAPASKARKAAVGK